MTTQYHKQLLSLGEHFTLWMHTAGLCPVGLMRAGFGELAGIVMTIKIKT